MAVKKTMWHGELRDLGQVEVEVKQEARKSTYNGKPDYVELIVGGNLRQYQVEAPQCGEFFRGRVGQKILIEARESREAATIHLIAPAKGQTASAPTQQQQRTDVRPQQQPTTHQPPADTRQPAPTNQPDGGYHGEPPPKKKTAEELAAEKHAAELKAINDAKKFAARRVNAIEIIFKAVDHLAERRKNQGRAITPEHFASITTSIFIDMNRAGIADTLPTGELDKYLPPEQPKQ